jgi:hypothetical protein
MALHIKLRIIDALLSFAVVFAAIPMRLVRRISLERIPMTASTLVRIGVFPITNHYYEPLYDFRNVKYLDKPRSLPAIDMNESNQIKLLSEFSDLDGLSGTTNKSARYPFAENQNFWSGDAELWFHVIRRFKPKKIIEIGSGYSTKMAYHAILLNKSEDNTYACEHTCIEPYEMPWLEDLGVSVIRSKVEDVDATLFDNLNENDILFIDSSHIIRPQGDVLLEYLHIIPNLKPGVIVHVHDIFTPRDYPEAWVKRPLFWNEQYLLEAFLSNNDAWEVLISANYLRHEHYDLMKEKCIWLTEDREPGSFYIRRRQRHSMVST